ncbi:MAG TPA: hypothetical protein VJB65_04930 [Patescibacteria group bacterium]|nr:hypothetical protein [Patescibacteria group bacterium]
MHLRTYHQPAHIISSLVSFTFRVLLVWYILAIFVEFLLPGFVSLYLNLDLFLWAVIISAVVSFTLERLASRHQLCN